MCGDAPAAVLFDRKIQPAEAAGKYRRLGLCDNFGQDLTR
jgi:hypothetical protein